MEITKHDIERGLSDEAFELYYQPKVNLLTGQISGAECLVRWNDTDKGFVPPDKFIPLAEQCGLITEITAQILPLAIDTIGQSKEQGCPISVAVNTSPMDFRSDQILSLLQNAVADGKITTQDLHIELTETATLENMDSILGRLNELTAIGFKLVMDDFGTGYSSIDLLSQLPFSTLKIDQGVVGRMSQSTKNLNIVNMIINMARTLRLHVVAEGVEDHHAYRFLSYAGCLEAQGYWISKPLVHDDFLKFVRSEPNYPSSQLGMIYHAQQNNAYFRKSVLDMVLFRNCDVGDEMAAVTSPDIHFRPEKTRLGDWYFGIGQDLSARENFKAIELPHRRMHELGKRLSTATADQIGKLVLEFNQAFEQVNNALHQLEAELIAEEPCAIWIDAKAEGSS